MSITASAIANNRVTFLALAVLVFSGLGALSNLPRAEDPGFTIRTAVVTTYLPGASPSRVERLVTDTIEEKVQEIPELDFVSSTTRTGVSLVFVNIKESESKMRPIWDDLRRKMQSVGPDLPTEAVGPFVDDDFGDVFPIMLTIRAPDFSAADVQDMADEIRDELLHLDQVAQVEIYGKQQERIFVEYNVSRLAEVGLSPGQLSSILAAQNIIISGGTLTVFGEDFELEPTGNYESIDDIGDTVIPLTGGRSMRLADLVDIRRGYVDPPTSLMHSQGERCVGLSIATPEGSGNVSVMGEEVLELVHRLQQEYPVGVDLDLVIFQPEFIDNQVDNFISNLLQAMGIVLLVMLFSLGLRTGLVVSTLIPTAMLATLGLMQLVGVGLNQISIAALIIALGMLVDNAIVMSESIQVQMREGKPALQAAIDSANELRIPLLTSSLTTSAAFLPIFLAESSIGEYTGSLFTVVTMALLSSWVLSLTMMPLLCVLFLRAPTGGGDSYSGRFYRGYRGALLALVRRPWLSLAGVVVIFSVAMYGFGFVPNVFMPKSDSARLIANLSYPLGTSIETTESMVTAVEDHLREEYMAHDDEEGFLHWSTFIGRRGGPRYRLSFDPAQDGSEHSQWILTATSRDFIDRIIPELERFMAERYPEVQQSWSAESLGPAAAAAIAVRLSGSDVETLFRHVQIVEARLRELPGSYNVENDWGAQTKKLRVVIDQARARRAGVSSQDVALSLRTGLSGIETTEYRAESDIIPILLRSSASDRTDLAKIENVQVFVTSTGQSIPLSQIAHLEVDWEPSKILRRDRYKNVTVSCDLRAGTAALDTARDLEGWLGELAQDWPRGYGFELGGDREESEEANASMAAKMPIAFFAILLLLISQFNSVRRTLIIFATIPLGMIGVTIGLLLTGQDFTFMALLGVVSLAGIIINNAIVLIDRIKIEMEDNGRSAGQAVIESAQRRLRPILVTTLTTAGGLVPLWLFGGPMWEPMAVTILFGLIFATLLTLGVVPVLFTILFRVRYEDL